MPGATCWRAKTRWATTTLTVDPYGYKAQYGYYTDRETGLILCTHRYYDPATGRWLTRDPIGYEGGINLYQYCGNDPVNGVDPEGEFFLLIPIAYVAIASNAALIGTTLAVAGAATYIVWDRTRNLRETVQTAGSLIPYADIPAGVIEIGYCIQERDYVGLAYNAGGIALPYIDGAMLRKSACFVTNLIRSGRRGGVKHQQAIKDIEDIFDPNEWEVIAGGSLKERRFYSSVNKYRYPDLVMKEKATGRLVAIQVGRLNKYGIFANREFDAFHDLLNMNIFDDVYLVGYTP